MPDSASLLIDPGENVWPTRWFGNSSALPFAQVVAAPWREVDGVVDGFDWSLPPHVRPSPNGLLTLTRSWYLPSTPSTLPELGFNATAIFHLWVTWRQLEPSEGVYNFDALLTNFHATTAAGWRVGIRILTARVADYAPEWLDARGVGTIDGGINYDPADPIFHARYLALLSALRALNLCQSDGLALAYVGYASTSFGDEYIGPCGHQCTRDPAEAHAHVRERLDAWARVCSRHPRKVMMGGESSYGTSLGFGTRNGFVEHCAHAAHRLVIAHPCACAFSCTCAHACPPPLSADWYLIPDRDRGQLLSPDDPYLRVNESAPLLQRGLLLGEENEEYSAHWSSEWRTWQPGARGGPFNGSAPMQGGLARYGPLASFPYRYLMSSLRLLQMRVNALLASPVVVSPFLYAYVALALGRTADDSPDAWAFLAATHCWDGKLVTNLERWLYQRSEPVGAGNGSGVVTYPDARITQTPAPPSNRTWMTAAKHDWIAQRAEDGAIGFNLDRRWVHAAQFPLGYRAVVKLSIFDVADGLLVLTTDPRRSLDGAVRPLSAPVRTVGDGQLKTFSVLATGLNGTADDARGEARTFDFLVRATNHSHAPHALVLSLVRVIKLPAPAAAAADGASSDGAGTDQRGAPPASDPTTIDARERTFAWPFGDADPRGVAVLLVLAGAYLVAGCALLLHSKRTRFKLSSTRRHTITP